LVKSRGSYPPQVTRATPGLPGAGIRQFRRARFGAESRFGTPKANTC